jgi:antitoxin ParD1/3/4
MATMNISLPAALEEYVEAKLASGGYTSASEVIREALRLLQEQDRGRLHALRVAVKEGLDAAAAGQVVSIDELSGTLIAERARRRRRRKRAEPDATAS